MKQFSKELGKVSITPKGDWNSSIANEKLDIVYDRRNNQAYIAKQDVPIGVDIDNREYWQPLNVSGYADNNFINLTAENENGTITAYESLEEAVATIFPINRRVGATLSFYNLNSDRLDRQAEFELWQFNSTDLANWENKDYWNNIYYNWNVFAGWYIDVDALKNHVETPNVGQYAYVGSNLNDALLYQCRINGTWTNTGIKVRNYISVVVSGNITIGENGNWFSDGEDTGIPATPAVDEQIDNIITKHESLSRTVQGIAATGGASTATNVTYNNDASGLNAENAQDAIDELQVSKIDKTSILQELGTALDKVMSQKAINTELGKKANKADVDTKFTEEKNRVDAELAKKFDKVSVAQESGEAEDKVMSQKATINAITDETTRATAAEQANATAIRTNVQEIEKEKFALNTFKKQVSTCNKDALYVVDVDGNIILKADRNGVNTTSLSTKSFNEFNNDALYIVDADGNIITKISKDGLEANHIKSYSGELTNIRSSSFNILDLKGNIMFRVSRMGVEASSFSTENFSSDDDKFYIVDNYGNVVVSIGDYGIDANIIKTKLIRSAEKSMSICDSYGNMIAQFEKGGIKTTEVKSSSVIAKTSKITNLEVETINGNKYAQTGRKNEDVEDKFETDFVGALMYGQSLGNACYSGPTVSNVCPYLNLFSFKGGVRTYDNYYLNSSGHPEGHTGKAPWITRNGEVRYGELIDYKNTLSAIDVDAIDNSYSELIPLVEKIQKYSTYTNPDNPDIGYKADMSGSIYMRHAAGEVPISGILESFDNLLIREDGYNVDGGLVNFIAECPDFGSATFRSMLPIDVGGKIHIETTNDATNLNYFELLSLDVYKAKEFCDLTGKTYSVGAIFYYHEGDWGSSYHYINKSARLRLFSRINQRVKEITGQENDVLFFMHQGHMSESHNRIDYELSIETEPDVYTEEQETAMKESFDSIKPTDGISLYDTPEYDKKKVFLGQPIYGYKYVDGTHLTSIESKKHGAAMGYAYKRTLIDEKPWLPIHPISHKITRVVVGGVTYYKTSVKFHVEVSPLVLDEDAVNGIKTSPSAQARGDKYGFIFATESGVLKGHSDDGTDFIKKIEIAKSNTINFYTIENTQGMQLHYAYDFIVAEDSYLKVLSIYKRPIGNLRDSRGDFYKIKINDEIGYAPIHNWSPSFNYVLI